MKLGAAKIITFMLFLATKSSLKNVIRFLFTTSAHIMNIYIMNYFILYHEL